MGGTPSTNSIESLNYQLRKVTKNRGHFPSDEAVIKLLWLAICDIEDKRARERDKDKGLPASKRRAKGKLVEGQTTTDWNKALAQLTTAYPDRFAPYLNRLHRNLDRLLWGAWCFSDWGSFSSRESIGWRPCQQRNTQTSSRPKWCVR